MNLFDQLESSAQRGIRVAILWRHHAENEIAQECGEEFGEELHAASFSMLPYQETP